MRVRFLSLLLVVSGTLSCATMHVAPEPYFANKAQKNSLVSLWLPFWGPRANVAYNHTLNGFPRTRSDCAPNCPQVDIWQYQYKPDGKNTLTSAKPIASLKAHWKAKNEARIIAVSMFDGKELYARGLSDYAKSFSHLKEVNKISDPLWGYETFTIRVYVAKRNPSRAAELGPLQNDTPQEMIESFLDRGFEVAYVDNGLQKTGKDGTFWRFMVAAEQMPEGQRIRYLSRDVDVVLNAGEAFSVGEWMASEYQFHRMHLIPVCLGPLTAMAWGGTHIGKGIFQDMKTLIEYFPYRLRYGDDELFTRDMVWPRIKNSGSVLTHHYERGVLFRVANPYKGSCEEPTQLYCDETRPGGKCPDVLMPKSIQSPLQAFAYRKRLKELKKDPTLFDLHPETTRGAAAIKALSAS